MNIAGKRGAIDLEDEHLLSLIEAAKNGSKDALEEVVRFTQPYVYNLALRMLQRPMDAEDAAQEILIKVITHLGQFRGESNFTTWVYRVAHNTLLNLLARRPSQLQISFEELEQRLEWSLAHPSVEDTMARAELVEEVRRSCTLGMLMCLNVEDRIALVLGELLELSSDEAAAILEISSAAYRKRLSRARQTLVAFVSRQCGIVNPDSPCRCHKHVRNKIQFGSLNPEQLDYAAPHDASSARAAALAEHADVDTLGRSLALLRAHPKYVSRRDLRAMLDELLEPGDPDA